MAEPEADLVEEYRRYLERFDGLHGAMDFGAYAKHHGRLVKKLRFEEFEGKWREYLEMSQAYAEIVERGDTINDIVVKILRERQDELMLERTL